MTVPVFLSDKNIPHVLREEKLIVMILDIKLLNV